MGISEYLNISACADGGLPNHPSKHPAQLMAANTFCLQCPRATQALRLEQKFYIQFKSLGEGGRG